MRPGCLIGGGLFLLGAVLMIAFVALQGRGGGSIELGSIEEYAPGSVVYFATDHVFVVRADDGTPAVFSDIDPHNPPGRRSCRVTFRPDLGAEGERGRFFDDCSGAMYDIAGRGLQGDGLDLERLTVEVNEDGRLSVPAAKAAGRASGGPSEGGVRA